MIEQETDCTSIPSIAHSLHCIQDPALRLRFLRASAPGWRRGTLTLLLWMVVLMILGLVVADRIGLGWSKTYAAVVGKAASTAPITPAAVTSKPAPALRKLPVTQEVWQVEKISSSESYSNGLQIDNKYSTANHPRSYVAFAYAGSGAASGAVPVRAETAPAGNTPVGIVYHTTENLAAPFDRNQNGPIESEAGSLLEYVKGKKAYNFVIDRFGRVFRVVQEEDAADHAGDSVWADEKALYVNLNESFLGVAIETRTAPGQEIPTLTEVQIRAIAMLTEMLRARYGIAAANCVTHAQVSVNPGRMLAGDHMDWASSFPFAEIGLPDNYARPLPSIALFGFEWDDTHSQLAGDRLASGAKLGAQQLAKHAAEAGVEVDVYRRILRKQYHERLAETHHTPGNPRGD